MAADPVKEPEVPRPRFGLLPLALLIVLVLWAAVHFGPRLWQLSQSALPEAVSFGGPFSLFDANGAKVTDKDLAGKPFALFFGYSHCPDVCPTTLQDMGAWLAGLGPDATRLRMVFITVDPARDTPAALKEYMSSFDPRILALTGNEKEVGDAMHAYRVYAKKVPNGSGDYSMDHTAATYLMDASGKLQGVLVNGVKTDEAVQKLKGLIAG